MNPNYRNGGANVLVPALLGAIVIALLVLITVVLWPSPERDSDSTKGRGEFVQGKTISGEQLPKKENPPKVIEEPKRIKETAVAGKTYEITVNGNFESRVQDSSWGTTTVVNMGYIYEVYCVRHIESNDGQTIVETRDFQRVASTKVLSETDFTINLGLPGTLVLGGLDFLEPGAGVAVLSVIKASELLGNLGVSFMANQQAAKISAELDGLTGKQVRITYINGEGVTAVETVKGGLTHSQLAYITDTAVLSDCYIFPDFDLKPGESWPVDGRNFGGLLDPSFDAQPRGLITVERTANQVSGGKEYANLRIKDGDLTLDASDSRTDRVGTFTPNGNIVFNLSEGHIESAQLAGRFSIETVSKDHILFETRFRSKPTLKINYSCRMR